jgi:hypothetical protein
VNEARKNELDIGIIEFRGENGNGISSERIIANSYGRYIHVEPSIKNLQIAIS